VSEEDKWFVKVGKVNGQWDYEVAGIMDWPQQDFDDFMDTCQNAIVAAKGQHEQNTRSLAAFREAMSATSPVSDQEGGK
jgi:hypothetical protein